MINIKCCNPRCPAPEGKFLWDESPYVGKDGGLAEPGDMDAMDIPVKCPYCGTECKIWLKKSQADIVVREE